MTVTISSTGVQQVLAAAGGNVYGLALKVKPSAQTILPALKQDGTLLGYYPLTSSYNFQGTEVSANLGDTTVPLTTVTRPAEPGSGGKVTQFVAAVFPSSIASNLIPWMSSIFVSQSPGLYQMHNIANGHVVTTGSAGYTLNALASGLNAALPTVTAAAAPAVTTPAAMTWAVSSKYAAITANNSFIDVNWQTLFKTKTAGDIGQRISIVSNPASGFVASIVPTYAVEAGTTGAIHVYNTIRITRIADVAPGLFTFNFLVYGLNGLTSAVVLNLTVL